MSPFPILSWSCQYRQMQICSFKISAGHALSPYSPQEGNSYFHSYSQESISKSEYLCVGVIGKIQTDIPCKCVTGKIQSLSRKKNQNWQVFKAIFQDIRCWLNTACYHRILYLIKEKTYALSKCCGYFLKLYSVFLHIVLQGVCCGSSHQKPVLVHYPPQCW